MKSHSLTLLKVSIFTITLLLFAITASALPTPPPTGLTPAESGWQDITVFDGFQNPSNPWYGYQEDNEVEYHSWRTQLYDLEAMFYNPDTRQLMIISGYDFSKTRLKNPGDIFLTTADSKKYVMDIDYSNRPSRRDFQTTYHLYSGRFTTTDDGQKYVTSSPNYRRDAGGTDEGVEGDVSFFYDIYKDTNTRWGITNTFQANNRTGSRSGINRSGKHHALVVDMSSWLNTDNFSAMNTMACGNDILRGSTVPEPTSFLLLGTGLLLFAHRCRRETDSL